VRFLRRILRRHYESTGEISPDAFKCRDGEDSLSFHEDCLLTQAGDYAGYALLPSGDRSGVVSVDSVVFDDLSLEVRLDKSLAEDPFHDVHYSSPCPEISARRELARRADPKCPFKRKNGQQFPV
jgi:hypothetical protein